MEKLTAIQQETLDFLISYSKKNLYQPSVQEIADHFGVSVRAICDRLDALTTKGHILERTGKNRCIIINPILIKGR